MRSKSPRPTDTVASPDQVLMAELARQGQVNRELACMFAALLKSKHNGRAFISKDVAEECYGDPMKPHGWLVNIAPLNVLKTVKLQAFTPDERPWAPPSAPAPGSAKEFLSTSEELKALSPEILDRIAEAMEEFSASAFKRLVDQAQNPEPEIKDEASTEVCGDDWHKHGVGLRCPTCGSKARIEDAVSA